MLMEETMRMGVRFGCRRGMCGRCVVSVEDSHNALNSVDENERATLEIIGKIPGSYRLACQCHAIKAATVKLAELE